MRDLSSGLTVWFTGLPSAGKTTLAHALAKRLADEGYERVEVLDGTRARILLSPGSAALRGASGTVPAATLSSAVRARLRAASSEMAGKLPRVALAGLPASRYRTAHDRWPLGCTMRRRPGMPASATSIRAAPGFLALTALSVR